MSRLLTLAVAALVATGCAYGCAQKTTPQQQTALAGVAGKFAPDIGLDPSLTVAVVNGTKVLAADLDAKIEGELGEASQEFTTKIHDLRRSTLEQMVMEKVVKQEADARGITEEALFKAEVEDKIEKPSDAALKELFEKLVAPQNPGLTFDAVKDQLAPRAMQQAQRTRIVAFMDELKAKYGVRLSLPAPKLPLTQVAATGPAKGPESAKVTIVEFSDFECPFCSRATETVKQVVASYGNKVRLVFRHYPLPFHKSAQKAAEAGACAADQDAFWKLHDAMFANQDNLSVDGLKKMAADAGLDGAKFDTCLDSGAKAELVKKDMEDGKKAGVSGTPAFFINGHKLSGAQPPEAFKDIIDAELGAK